MNNDLIMRLLRAVPLFKDFTADELGKFLAACRQMQLPENYTVLKQDRDGSEMYAVMSGSLQVSCHAATPYGKPLELAVLKPGDVFGELALVDYGPRSASVITKEASRLICFDRDQVPSLPTTLQVKLYHNVALLLAKRLRDNNDKLSVLLSHQKPKPEVEVPKVVPNTEFVGCKPRDIKRAG